MKYVYTSGLIAVMFALAPVFAFAETAAEEDTEAALRARIAELVQKVGDLEALVANWKARGGASAAATQTVQERRLERLLRVGMTGDDVRALQEALAKEPGVYPEGLVTGYYGPLTEAAVSRLKAKHNLEEEGVVFGPKMQAFLNQWLRGEGVKNLPAPGQMMSTQTRAQVSDKQPEHVQELLRQIRAGVRGEELRKNWQRTAGDGVEDNEEEEEEEEGEEEEEEEGEEEDDEEEEA
jgi:peptidoglycan hydrolase-like protein with peptidoglycan-binding domain